MPQAGSVAHVLVGAAVALPAVLFTTAAADPLNVVKMTSLLLCALFLLVVGATHAVTSRQLRPPWGPPAAGAALLLLAVAIAAAVSPASGSALFGEYGRNSGLLTYAAALIVFAAVILVFDRRSTRLVLYALMVAGAFTASYGLLQYVGVDLISWNSPNQVIAALGNTNFAAAYVAICLPAFLWLAQLTRVAKLWRIAAGAGAVLCLAAALLSRAVQGPLAAAAGVAVLAAAWLLGQPAAVRRRGLSALAATGTAGAAVLAWGASSGGPAARLFDDTGSRARGWFWEAAVTTWLERPFLGVGLDNFRPYWLRNRTLEAVQGLGAEDVTDAAHSVPLHLLATGGLLLLVAYLAFIGLTGWALLHGLRRLEGPDRLLLGALGGCWAAYQVQSFVSIDQVPLLITHYVLAGAIFVVAGRAPTRLIRLPGAAVPQAVAPAGGRKRPRAAMAPRQRAVTPADRVLIAALVVVGAVLAWQVLAPLRADVAARSGDLALRQGDGTPALMAYQRATELLPSEPSYWRRYGQLLLQAEQPEQALAAYRRGLEADPNDVEVVNGAARAAAQAGDQEAARAYHQQALRLHPYSPRTLTAAADFEFQQGRRDEAQELLSTAVDVLPQEAVLWAALGELYAASGDDDAARKALERALALDPQVAGASERLQSLDS